MATLKTPFVVQPAITATTFEILQNIDEPKKGTLKSLVELNGNPSLHVWVDIYGGSNEAEYNNKWQDTDVEAAVKNHFAAQQE